MKTRLLHCTAALALALAGSAGLQAQLSISSLAQTGNTYTYFDDFTGFLGTGDPANWVTSDVGSDASAWQGTNTGTSTTGGKYSYGNSGAGASFDGSLGFLPTLNRALYADIAFVNDTGSTIEALTIAYTAEQWRSASNGRTNGWTVSYSVGADPFVNLNDLAFAASNTNPTGGSPSSGPWMAVPLSQSLSGLSIASGETITVRFFGDNGPTGSGSRQGVAIDDFSFSATISPASSDPGISAVPEPSTYGLIGIGLLAALAGRRAYRR
ncbi:MAG: PEP-CTERM sorting domain-containing protein [Puniceicoccaceae bacterium]|nr:MAG: PEP-CTERM sorting domain-containing protein [Puniceicoccaceae bacterium]